MKGRRNRILAVAGAVGRDLLRRRSALTLLILLPAAFYVSVMGEEIPDGAEPWTLYVGTVGIAWAVAGGAFFLALAARRVDVRLLLGGYTRADLMAGRVMFLLGFAALIATGYSVLLSLLSGASWWPLALATASTGAIAVSLGLALASVLPRELEGTIALVLIVGVQSSVPLSSPVAPYLPFHGPMQLVGDAWFGTGPGVASLVHAALTSALLLATSWIAWSRATYVRPPAPRVDAIEA